MIHPAVRVVTLCVLVAFLATGQIPELIAGAVAIAVVYRLAAVPVRPAVTMLRRLRWFFVSIVVLFTWFTPGDTIASLAFLGSWAPSMEGIQGGLLRMTALILIVLAVNALLQSTPRDRLLGAVYWLTRPLNLVGLSNERLAVRATLVLEKVDAMRDRAAAARAVAAAGPGGAVTRARDVTVRLFHDVIDHAEREPLQTLVIDRPVAPAPFQWGLPLVLFAVLWLV